VTRAVARLASTCIRAEHCLEVAEQLVVFRQPMSPIAAADPGERRVAEAAAPDAQQEFALRE
jgi:hypothetical protein